MSKEGCILCGKTDKFMEVTQSPYCTRCKTWTEMSTNRLTNYAVIDGTHYTIGKAGLRIGIKMSSKKDIKIIKNGEEIVTNELWCNGTVPENFRDIFPDDAQFI